MSVCVCGGGGGSVSAGSVCVIVCVSLCVSQCVWVCDRTMLLGMPAQSTRIPPAVPDALSKYYCGVFTPSQPVPRMGRQWMGRAGYTESVPTGPSAVSNFSESSSVSYG